MAALLEDRSWHPAAPNWAPLAASGDSGDTAPYAVDREYEDLDAVIDAAGGSAYALGNSGGGILALDAAARGLAITKLAVWEPPYILDGTRPPVPKDYRQRLSDLLAAGRRGDMVELFMTQAGGAASRVRRPPARVAALPVDGGGRPRARQRRHDRRRLLTTYQAVRHRQGPHPSD